MAKRTSGRVRRHGQPTPNRRTLAHRLSSAALWLATATGLVVTTVVIQRAWAQADADTAPTVFVAADRKITQALRNSQELLTEKRFSEAVRLLGSVLEAPEDYFVTPERKAAGPEKAQADPNQPRQAPPNFRSRGMATPLSSQYVARSLKSEAQRLIGEMPVEGREAYELQFGAEAQRLLDAAARTGQVNGLAEVSRRFFHTKAGHDATELLGTCLLERGQPQAAAFCFQRLIASPLRAQFEPGLSLKLAVAQARSSQRDKALATVQALSAQVNVKTIELSGKEVSLADRGAVVAWLDQQGGQNAVAEARRDDPWLMYRGNAARNAASSGSTPLLNRRWAVPTLYDPEPRKLDLERLIETRRQVEADQGEALIPGAVPLAVNDHIVVRTTLGVMAVNFRTGKRIWFQEDPQVRSQLDRFAQETNANQPVSMPPWLEMRLWNDAIYGTMSSDGQFVFCVEDLPLEQANPFQRNVFLANGGQRDTTQRAGNRLAVYGFARQGAIECDSTDIKELAGAFFLGPPLPLDGRLYAVVEVKGEIRLVSLKVSANKSTTNARTGKIKLLYQLEQEWSQQLAGPERTVMEDTHRRQAGASPSFADGLLICPTTAGAVVAVDLTTRALVWGYQYPRNDNTNQRHMMAFVNGRQVMGQQNNEGWVDGCVTLASGKVLVSPVETTKLYCLNLNDGKLAWEMDRGDGLFVGGVHDNKVIVVGNAAIRAVNLADGKQAWTTPYPGGHGPSGRGFLAEGRYCLPLSSAEVASVELTKGQIVSRARSRTGQAAGNLICYQGAVISQSANNVESFYQLSDLQDQVASSLAANPQDAAALALRGDLQLDKGDYSAAITDLRTSIKLRPDPRTRRLLFEALLERLRGDFAKHQTELPELESLIDQPSQRLSLLRIVAMGQQQSGDVLAAFDSYLKIMSEQPTDDLERIDRTVAVRRDRWVQARIKDLRDKASAGDLPKLEQALRKQLDVAIASPTPELLRRFIDYFGAHPLANDARETLLSRTGVIDTKLEEELLLRQLETSDSPARAASAVARVARLLHESGRDVEGAGYFDRLRGPLAKVECLDGKTGAEITQKWFGERTPTAITSLKHWPKGKVEVERGNSGTIQQGVQNFPIDIRGGAGPFYEGWSIELVYHPQQALVAKDRLGREQWRTTIVDPQNRNGFFFQQQALNSVRVDGHLMVASLGFQLIGIDTLGGAGKDGPRVLWRHDLIDPATRDMGGMNWRQVNLPWGAPRIWAFDSQGRPLGATGPLSRDGICFQRQRNLICVHPLTGKTLWTRFGIPPGSELFGDDEYLFVVTSSGEQNKGDQEATVYRMLDGQELGKRKVPPLEQRLMTLGRKMLVWSTKDNTSVTLRDLWTEKDTWTRKFAAGAKPWPIGDEAVAVLQRDGAFTVLNALDGRPSVEIHLRDEPNLSEMAVHRSAERDFLFVSRPPKNGDGFGLHVVPQGGQGISVLNGWVYAFDRSTGKLVWERSVERRSVSHNQPPDLPVIVFASLQQIANGSGQQVSLMALDKRDGRVVLDDKFPNQGPALELAASPEKNEMSVRLNRGQSRLTFTDKAAPVEKPAGEAKPAEKEKPAADKKAAAAAVPVPIQPAGILQAPGVVIQGQGVAKVQLQIQVNPGLPQAKIQPADAPPAKKDKP